jgi:uncharacterized membrane protein
MPTRTSCRTLWRFATSLGALVLADAAAANTYTQISDPNAGSLGGPAVTWAYGINNAGTIVGFYEPNGAGGGQALSEQGLGVGFVLQHGVYTDVNEPNAAPSSTQISGINNAGVIWGEYNDASGVTHGFIESGGVFTTIDEPNASAGFTEITGVLPSGEIIGVYEYFQSPYLLVGTFTDVGGVFTTLPDATGAGMGLTEGLSASASGVIAGTYYDPSFGTHGYVDNGGVFTTIDYPDHAGLSYVFGISPNGSTVGGGYWAAPSIAAGFVESNGVFTPVNDPGGALGTQVNSINDDGVILGDYEDASGDFYGFTTALPEPAAWTMMILGVGAIGASLRRRRAAAPLMQA